MQVRVNAVQQPWNWTAEVADNDSAREPTKVSWLKLLEDVGADGWELVAVTPTGEELWAFFKRPASGEPVEIDGPLAV